MNKKSSETKNIYRLAREKNGLTRDRASEILEFISPDRLDRIEREVSAPHPDEVIQMSECYKMPELCNHYCTTECPIGDEWVTPIENKDLPRVTLEILSSLHKLEAKKGSLIDVSADGKITPDEYASFQSIQKDLLALSASIDSLQLWLKQKMASSEIAEGTFED